MPLYFSAFMSEDLVALTAEDPSSITEIKDDTTDINPLIADEENEITETVNDQTKVEIQDPIENMAGSTTINADEENEVKETVDDQAKVEVQDPNENTAGNNAKNADEENEVNKTVDDQAKVEVQDPNENTAGNNAKNADDENKVKETVTDQAKVEVQDPDKDNPTLNTDEEEAKDTAPDETSVAAHDAIQEQTLTSDSVVDTAQNKSDLVIENTKGEGSNKKLEDQSQTTSGKFAENVEEKLEDQVKEQNPIMEKLLMFINDPRQKTLKFSHDISTHDRIMVHKFVQDNNLTCESTGNNRNHEFVVGKVMIDRFMGETFVQESTFIRESSSNNAMNESADDEVEELDYGSEVDEVEMAGQEEDRAAQSNDPEDIVELHTDTQVGMVTLKVDQFLSLSFITSKLDAQAMIMMINYIVRANSYCYCWVWLVKLDP